MKTLYLPGCWRRSKRKIVYAWFCTEAGEISSGPPVYSFLTFSIKLCMKSARADPPLDHDHQRISENLKDRVEPRFRLCLIIPASHVYCTLLILAKKRKERIDIMRIYFTTIKFHIISYILGKWNVDSDKKKLFSLKNTHAHTHIVYCV